MAENKSMKTEEGKSMEKAAEIHALEFVPPEEKWKEHHEIEFNKRRSSFIAGWQEREEEIERLKNLLVKYEQWEADIIGNDEMWWPNKAKDSLPDEIYNTMLELQSERNELLKRFTPESYNPLSKT